MRLRNGWALLQALPLAAVLAVFLVVPMITLIVVSFFDYDSVQIIPGFVLTNYRDVLFSATTWWTYLDTLKFTVMVWAITLFVGFWVAYFLTFVVQSRAWQMTWFLVCTVPFLTSNIIRMISWVPFLGRNGLLNSAL
ncbi:MAG TPA: ABC transporter permease, partial [Acetobacteraceae bacterium]|nr:ABC transporter permease [Acetobacteraceae bacterium]